MGWTSGFLEMGRCNWDDLYQLTSTLEDYSFVFVSGTPKCCHTVNEILKQAVKEAELYKQAGVVILLYEKVCLGSFATR